MAPQSNHVLLCSNCKTFQSQIVKKSNKWECKVCGVKQSVLKVFGEGSGADCRQIVGKLNYAKGVLDQEAELNQAIENHSRELEQEKLLELAGGNCSGSSESGTRDNDKNSSTSQPQQQRVSKWSVFENTEHRNLLDFE